MKRIIGLIVAGVLMAGMLAVPASAATINPAEILAVGAFTGAATVGKTITGGTCSNTSYAPTLGGGGLGLPTELKRNKTAWYTLSTTFLVAVAPPLNTAILGGALDACGQIAPALTIGKAAVGAACGASSGHDGFGSATIGTVTKKLRNLGWVTAVGGLLPVTGRVAHVTSKKPQGHVVALVLATGAGPCADKAAGAKPAAGPGSGATAFTVVGAFAMVN